MSNPHVDAVGFEEVGQGGDVGLSVVVGEEDAGTDEAGGTEELVGCHGVGLVAGEKGDVDVVEVCHLGDVLGVAGNVDAEAVEGEDVAVVASFGMELEMPFGDVVGRNGFDGDEVGEGEAVAVVEDVATTCHVGTTLVGDEACVGGRKLLDGLLVEVVAMLVGDKDVVCLRIGGVVGGAAAQLANGVNLDFLAVEDDADAGVHEGVDLYRLAVGCGEYVHFFAVLHGGRCLGGLFRDGHVLQLPCEDAALEVDDLEAFLCQHLAGFGGSPTALAIDGDGLVLLQLLSCLLEEGGLVYVDVDGVLDVSFGKLFGGANVNELYVRVLDELGELLHVDGLEGLLAASGVYAQT